MSYLLIPLREVALVDRVTRALEAGGLRVGAWDELSRTFERTIQTCELLATYALAMAGNPSRQ